LRAIPSFQHRHPEVRLILLSVNDPAEIGDEGIDVLIRPRSARQRRGEHKPPQGLVMRKLLQSPIVVCASPEYLKRAGIPRTPSDLAEHACLAVLTLERDVQDEWNFAKSDTREKIKFAPTLTAHGDELREAGLAGCGIIRLLACSVEDEVRSGALVRVLPDWECGGLPIVATYRKTRPTLSPVTAFVGHLAQAFQRYGNGAAARA
jgi:LysR family transcriptional regulator for bpeEF and oprC